MNDNSQNPIFNSLRVSGLFAALAVFVTLGISSNVHATTSTFDFPFPFPS
jgi:hypothetical protein